MKKIFNFLLVLFMLYSLFFVIGAVLAPLFAYLGLYDLSAKITYIFVGSCHQNPLRSFYLMGYPFSLCARCFGVYLACTIACIFLLNNKFRLNKLFTAFLIIFIVIDITLNVFFLMDTGNIIRFFAGISIGLILTKIIQYLLKKGETL